MSELSKTRYVCDISPIIDHAAASFILFEYRDQATGFVERTLVLPRKEWSLLGCPMQITVTVEPDNKLEEEKK